MQSMSTADAYPHAACLTQGRFRVGNGAMHIQYQLEVNRCRNEEVIVKGNFEYVCGLRGGAPRVEIDRIVIREVQYQLEVNRCKNEEIIEKGIFGGCGLCWLGAPGLVMGPCIVEIDLNRCRNEEIIVKGNCGWVWSMFGMGPCIVEIDRIVIRECRNEEIIAKGNFGWAWSMWAGPPRIDRIVIRDVQYQLEINRCRNEEVNVSGLNDNS
ncbi:hypothetical protein DPMN_128227 [Dreissena polymorpha]|uniref:Uncharacterized protein n=1 Tax=Dreissena polymorpha TaxID=45954 RepID=A0A9D4JZH5_DREPO|nr:hypothetical protein DPMN_128227 [Dreissena polymorpha]